MSFYQQQQPHQEPQYYPLKWVTRVQGRAEMMAVCSAAKREGAVLLVRLTSATCAPCQRTEPIVRAMLDAVAGLSFPPSSPPPPAKLWVYSLDVDEAGSSDVYKFYTTRKQCRGVPAAFVYRGSEDLHAPDISHDGGDLHGLARLFARAAAVTGPRDLRDEGAMHRKMEPDLAFLRSTLQHHDVGVSTVLQAAEPFLVGVPAPRTSTVPLTASEMVGDTRRQELPPQLPPQLQLQQQQQQPYCAYDQGQYQQQPYYYH